MSPEEISRDVLCTEQFLAKPGGRIHVHIHIPSCVEFAGYFAENPIVGFHSENPNPAFSSALLGNLIYILADGLQSLFTDHNG
jgi:hypothetical protein